jgi:membrane protein DedA with SNARE-associated domain
VQAYLEQLTQLALASPWLLGVLVAMAVVDALLPIVPSEALIIGAGVAAAAGEQNLLVVIGAAALGSFIGETIGYLIGRVFGPAVRDRFEPGGTKATAYDRFSRLLAARGGTVLLTARFVPAGRTVATITAGAMRYPTGRFLTFTAMGTPLSAGWSAMLGYLGGATFAQNPLFGLAFGLTLGTVVGLVIGAVQRRRTRAEEPARPVLDELPEPALTAAARS